MKDEIRLLISDLKKSIKIRKDGGRNCFHEELVILRLRQMLKNYRCEIVYYEVERDDKNI